MKAYHYSSGSVYGLGLLGALFWAVRSADGVGSFLIGLLQALFWPAVLVYKAFTLLS